MKIKSKLIILCFVVAGLASALGLFSMSQLEKIINPLKYELLDKLQEINKLNEAQKSIQLIEHYNYLLADYAKNYAHSPGKYWEQKYKETEQKLDKTLQNTLATGNDNNEIISDIIQVRSKLANEEQISFDLANNGHTEEAHGVLDSQDYSNYRQIFQNDVERLQYDGKDGYSRSLQNSDKTPGQLIEQTGNIIDENKKIISVVIPLVYASLICLIILFSKTILRPIRNLMESVAQISKGDLESEIKLARNDEVGELAKEFDSMRMSLKGNISLLRMAEKRYRGFYEQSTTLNRTITTTGVIVDCNDYYVRELGYSRKEIIGSSIFDYAPQKEHDRLKNEFQTWKETGVVTDHESWLQRKDGTTFLVLYRDVNLYDENNVIIGQTASMVDVTESYEARKTIQEYSTKIEDQLRELQEKDRQKEEFSSMISHELKTPLVPIRGYSEMLKEPELLGTLNEAQLNAVDVIRDASIRLENMIMNLLDSHKIDIKQLKFNKENIALDEFMGKIYSNFIPSMAEKKISFVNSTNQKSIIVGDSDRLTQVISNLIQNAIEFVPKETGKIEIGTQDKGDTVVIYVKDNGIGIPKEKQGSLFKKFYQVDCSHKRAHRGTGLGLAICIGIVEEMHGAIAVDSELGKGATFLITLPSIENQTNHSLDEKNPTKSVSIMSTMME